MPLGIDARAAYPTHRVKSVPGVMLVLYTDGAIEHSRNVLEGETLLLEAVEAAAENRADDPAKAICDGIFSRHRVSDDVAPYDLLCRARCDGGGVGECSRTAENSA